MIDLQLLRIMKYRQDFYRVRGRIPASSLDKATNLILEDYGHYFKTFPDDGRVEYATFLPIFRARHPTLKEESVKVLEDILTNALTKDVSETTRDGIMESVLQLRLGTEMARLLAQFDAGEVPSIQNSVSNLLDEFKSDARVAEIDYIRTDISELLKMDADDSGLRWRLDCLNKTCRGLRGGDFGIIAGRPDKGKTTLIASELTMLASQLPHGKDALWLNNEGPGHRIKPRLYQAALGATMSELIEMDAAGVLHKNYEAAMGHLERIKILDIHGQDCFSVEALIDKFEPGLVVYDMIDKVRGFADSARTDLGLERMYDWGRDLAVDRDLAALATSQISNEGDGLQFPTLGMLKDSKTGKQGACDFQIMIGASNDPGLANARYIGMPKNKLRREGVSGDPRATVKYAPQRARYEDIPYAVPEGEEEPDEQE